MQVSIFFIFCIVFAKFSSIFGVGDDDRDSKDAYRLVNDHMSVLSYKLRITPNLKKNFTFDGEVDINIYPRSAIECITINSKNLQIKNIRVFSKRFEYIATHQLIPEKEMLKICVSPKLSFFTLTTVHITYTGTINGDFKGLYRIPYEENDVKKWVLATQFEPTYARMVFPCFDEPEYQAKFTLTIVRNTDQVASSITKISSTTTNPDNRTSDKFQETAPRPSYTMAFVIHELTSRTENTYMTIYSKKHTQEDVQFFTSNHQRWKKELEKYMNVKYDTTLDIVLEPSADEYTRKAGLLIFKDKDVLQIDGIDMENHQEEIAKIAIHKMTHLWLGGYVTPYWWDVDTWLSESFAVFFGYLITSQVEPTWRMDDLFNVKVLQKTLFEEDEISSGVSVWAPVAHPSKIQDQKFGSVTDNKGASIIRMLEHLVTSDSLKKSFQQTILKSYSRDGTVESTNLLNEIQNEIRKANILPPSETIHSFMSTWMKNLGHPLVKVSRTVQGSLEIVQEVHRSPLSLQEIPDQNWIISITCAKQESQTSTTEKRIWSVCKNKVTVNMGLKDKEWALCNLQQTGYYRVNYDDMSWEIITEQLKTDLTKIDVKSRAQLVDDSYHLALTKKLNYSITFQLGTYLEKEEDMLPWLSYMKYINYFLQLYEKTNVEGYLENYFAELLRHQYDRIGFEGQSNDSYFTRTNRPSILTTACHLNLADCLTKVSEVYNNNINDLTKVPAEWKYVVYCTSFKIIENKETAWNKLWAIYKNSNITSEKEVVLGALACARDTSLLRKYVETAISDQTVYKSEKEFIIKSVSQSFNGVTAVLDVCDELVSNLSNQTEQTIQTLGSIIAQTSFNMQSNQHVAKLEKIIVKAESNETKNEAFVETLKTSQARALVRMEYKNNNSEEIQQAIYTITGYTPPPPTTQSTTQPTTAKPSQTTQPQTTTNETTSTTPKTPSSSNNLLPNFMLYYVLFFVFIVNYALI